jgi:hypothetical protein
MISMSRLVGAAAIVLACSIAVPVHAEMEVKGDWAAPDTVITMQRGGCERRCPAYLVVIFASGTVIVQGQHYLKRPVLAKGEVPAADVQKLVERFNALRYFDLADAYRFHGKGCEAAGTSDGPNVVTTIVTGGRGKSLVHHMGCLGEVPRKLTELEHAIDETAHASRWLGRAVPAAGH